MPIEVAVVEEATGDLAMLSIQVLASTRIIKPLCNIGKCKNREKKNSFDSSNGSFVGKIRLLITPYAVLRGIFRTAA